LKKEEILRRYLEKNFPVEVPKKQKVVDLFVKTILSQNTNDRNRDRAYKNLREKFRRWEEVLSAPLSRIESAIKPAGLSKQKSKTIKRLLKKIYERWKSFEIDRHVCMMEKEEFENFFLSIKGIGVKTVNVVWAFGCGKSAFPVDTHIYRISKRLGLIPEKASREKAHEILGSIFRKDPISIHLQMIEFGRKICRARNPLCKECALKSVCPQKRLKP